MEWECVRKQRRYFSEILIYLLNIHMLHDEISHNELRSSDINQTALISWSRYMYCVTMYCTTGYVSINPKYLTFSKGYFPQFLKYLTCFPGWSTPTPQKNKPYTKYRKKIRKRLIFRTMSIDVITRLKKATFPLTDHV